MKAIVLGGASCLWSDILKARTFGSFDQVYAVNDAAVEFGGRVMALCTLHPEKVAHWIAQRSERGFPPVGRVVSHAQDEGVDALCDYRWPGMTGSGSSGLFAVKVALEAGCKRIVLAGVPMEQAGAHFFDKAPWGECTGFLEAWAIAKDFYAPFTRSMSGWTKDLLGPPTREWLASSN